MSQKASGPAPVDLTHAKDQLWLMKVPKRMMDHWQGLQAGVSLGTVEQSGGSSGNGGPSYTLRLSEEAGYPAELPREYAMRTSSPAGGMYIISRPLDSQKGKVQLEGHVVHKGDVNLPEGGLSRSYKELVHSRELKSRDRPVVQIVGEDELRPWFRPALHGKRAGSGKPEKVQKSQRKDPANNMPQEELENLLFEKFAEQQYWRRKALVEATGQTSMHLTSVLEQVAEQVRYGSHKGEYTLKAEFQQR